MTDHLNSPSSPESLSPAEKAREASLAARATSLPAKEETPPKLSLKTLKWVESLQSELASLKEEQLTAEEASAILYTPLNVPDTHWSTADFEVYSSGLEKLRALSTKGTEE